MTDQQCPDCVGGFDRRFDELAVCPTCGGSTVLSFDRLQQRHLDAAAAKLSHAAELRTDPFYKLT